MRQAPLRCMTFRCTWLEGDPYPADGEMTHLAGHGLDDLHDMSVEQRRRILAAVDASGEARFEGGA
jgi:hypothetical protein